MIASTKNNAAFQRTVVTRSFAVPTSSISIKPITSLPSPRPSQVPPSPQSTIGVSSPSTTVKSLNNTIYGLFTEDHTRLSIGTTSTYSNTATTAGDKQRGSVIQTSTQSTTLARYELNFFIAGPVIYVDFSISQEDNMNTLVLESQELVRRTI